MATEETDTGEWQRPEEDRDLECGRQERAEVREYADEASNFLGCSPPAWLDASADDSGDSLEEALVEAAVAAMYVLVPASAPKQWWRDSRLGIGACRYHAFPAGYPIEDNPCPYQACSVPVAGNPKDLYRAVWSEALSESPDMPRGALWREILGKWRVERIELNMVRVAWLQNDPVLAGGEPQLRRDGRLRGRAPAASWERLRDMLRRYFASLVVVGGDPQGLGLAARLIVFKVPFTALWEARALTSAPVELRGRATRLPRLRLGNRLLIVKLLNWPPEGGRLRDRLHFRLTMWRAHRRKAAVERRARRHARRAERRATIRRELGLDEADPESRARIRRELIGTLRESIGLVQALAEGMLEFAKALRGVVLALLLLPAGLVVTVLVRLLLG